MYFLKKNRNRMRVLLLLGLLHTIPLKIVRGYSDRWRNYAVEFDLMTCYGLKFLRIQYYRNANIVPGFTDCG